MNNFFIKMKIIINYNINKHAFKQIFRFLFYLKQRNLILLNNFNFKNNFRRC